MGKLALLTTLANVSTMVKQCSLAYYVAEIVFFCYKIGESMLDPSVKLYIYEIVSIKVYGNDTTEQHLLDSTEKENLVQKQAANYILLYKVLLNAPAILLGLFCGAWSDVVGRKIPVILALMGTILAAILYILSSLVTDWAVFIIVFGGAISRGSCGKSSVITMALHSYVCDISKEGKRTKKLSKLLAMSFFGCFIGYLLAGALLEKFDLNVVFCVVIGMNALCVIITITCMKKSVQSKKADENRTTSNTKPTKSITMKLRHIKESLQVVTKPREGNKRAYIIILFITFLSCQVAKSGEIDITLLLVEKSPLNWRKSMYGYFIATDYVFSGLALFVIPHVVLKYCHVNDLYLIMAGLCFRVVSSIILAFSTETWMVFLSVVIGCPRVMIISSVKSIISKLVNKDEIGKSFSLLSAGEGVSNLLGSLFLLSIYKASQHIFTGMSFIISAVLYLVLLVIVILVARKMRSANINKDLNILAGVDRVHRCSAQGGAETVTCQIVFEILEPPWEKSEASIAVFANGGYNCQPKAAVQGYVYVSYIEIPLLPRNAEEDLKENEYICPIYI